MHWVEKVMLVIIALMFLAATVGAIVSFVSQ